MRWVKKKLCKIWYMLLRKRKYGGLLYVRILLNFISVALLFHLALKDSSKCMVNFY